MMKFRIILHLTAALLAGCATAPQQRHLSDPQIAMVMRVANLGEVREGEVAREKGTDAAVRDFGAMMVNEHTSQSNKAEAEFARSDIASEDTGLSRQMDADSGAATDRLRGLAGRDFDRAYIDRQVQQHQSVLGLIDSRLMPSARHKVVRDQLTELRKLVDKHLARSKEIQAALAR